MDYMVMLLVLLKLVIVHALCDFSLQTSAMASGKNRHRAPKDDALPPGQKPAQCWPYWLSAHALIHAGGVWVVTGDPRLAVVELVSHWWFDFAKCENWTTPHVDQAMHAAMRVIYAVVVAFGI